ncbi:hypothetical protein D3C80_1730330 [compost metagenome]
MKILQQGMNFFQIREQLIGPDRRQMVGILCVRQPLGFDYMGYSIEPESVYTFLEPPLNHVMKLINHSRVIPVQVRLLFGIEMEIIAVGSGIMFPDGTAKVRLPVVWRPAILTFAPDIVIAFGVVFR